MKSATNGARRSVVEVLRRADLLDPAAVHDRDPVAHRQRLLLVVGHVDERDPDVHLDPLELQLEALPELQVERAQRLVEEEDGRLVDEGTRERDPLLLATGELVCPALLVAGEVDLLEDLAGPSPDLAAVDATALEAEGDVAGDVEVREQGVALEDHVDRALVRRVAGHVAAAKLDPAGGRQVEAADHPQGRGLAAPGRPEQREELARPDRQGDVVDRDDIAEPLREVREADLGLGSRRGLGVGLGGEHHDRPRVP